MISVSPLIFRSSSRFTMHHPSQMYEYFITKRCCPGFSSLWITDNTRERATDKRNFEPWDRNRKTWSVRKSNEKSSEIPPENPGPHIEIIIELQVSKKKDKKKKNIALTDACIQGNEWSCHANGRLTRGCQSHEQHNSTIISNQCQSRSYAFFFILFRLNGSRAFKVFDEIYASFKGFFVKKVAGGGEEGGN